MYIVCIFPGKSSRSKISICDSKEEQSLLGVGTSLITPHEEPGFQNGVNDLVLPYVKRFRFYLKHNGHENENWDEM